jgi:hypothetical protein
MARFTIKVTKHKDRPNARLKKAWNGKTEFTELSRAYTAEVKASRFNDLSTCRSQPFSIIVNKIDPGYK